VDFSITSNLEAWVILRSATGESSVILCKEDNIFNCELETPWEKEDGPADPDIDPKQAYLDFLFHPGRFPVAIINKALSIYRYEA